MLTPGRKTSPITPKVDLTTNPKALAKAGAALTEMSLRSADIAERFADGMAYDRDRIISEARFLMSQSAEAMLEAGKRLIQLKENEPWGMFTSIVQDQLGLNERTARVMMQAAAKYLSPALESKRQPIAVLGRSKLFDLMVESDEDLVELAEGGTLAGKTLDEMQSMTRLELQAALREERQTLASRQKLLDKANAKNDRLQEKLDKPFVPDEAVAAANAEELSILETLKDAVLAAQAALMQLGSLVQDIDAKGRSEELRALAANDMEYLAQTFAQVLVDGGIAVQFEEIVSPSWIKKAGKKTGKGG